MSKGIKKTDIETPKCHTPQQCTESCFISFCIIQLYKVKSYSSIQIQLTSSATHPISGTGTETTPSFEFNLPNFSQILALRSLPDSTLSIPTPSQFDGRLKKPPRGRGEPNTEPILDTGLHSSTLTLLMKPTNSLTFTGGTPYRDFLGEESRTEVGDETNDSGEALFETRS